MTFKQIFLNFSMASLEFCKNLNFDHFFHALHDGEWMIWPLQNILHLQSWISRHYYPFSYDNSMGSNAFCINVDSQSSFSIKILIRQGRIRRILRRFCTYVFCIYNLHLVHCYHFLTLIYCTARQARYIYQNDF